MQKLSCETTSLKPRLDWLTVIGDIPHINYLSDSLQIGMIDDIIEGELGIPLYDVKSRRVYICGRSGIQISFEKLRGAGSPSIQICFKGTFFLNTNKKSASKIRRVLNFIWERFSIKAAPRVSRYDVALDIFDAEVVDVLPDIKKGRWEMVSNTKKANQPYYRTFHRDPRDLSRWTGANFGNSKYELRFYDRRLTLKKSMRKDHYIQYYHRLYEGHNNVLRMEMEFRKGNPLKLFTMGFFKDFKPLDELLKECLALFHKHHRLRNKKTGKEHINWAILFFADSYKSLTQYQKELNLEISFEQMKFYEVNKDWESALSLLAKRLVAARKTEKDDLKRVGLLMPKAVDSQKGIVAKEKEQFEKTQKIFNDFLQTDEPDWWGKELRRRSIIARKEGFLRIIS